MTAGAPVCGRVTHYHCVLILALVQLKERLERTKSLDEVRAKVRCYLECTHELGGY